MKILLFILLTIYIYIIILILIIIHPCFNSQYDFHINITYTLVEMFSVQFVGQ